jgi:hypothetical protein
MSARIHQSAVVSVLCPTCGEAYPATKSGCPYCTPITTERQSPRSTRHVARTPIFPPIPRTGHDSLPRKAQVWLQFLPSGICVALPLDRPVILGRQPLPDDHCDLVDLTDLAGFEHGVSRAHCMVQRRGTRLVVIDLGSTNGTFLNDQPVLPYQERILAHGDRLILGTLHLELFFDLIEDEPRSAPPGYRVTNLSQTPDQL